MDELLSINVPWSQEFSSVLRFWIIFTIIILNFLSGRLSISSSFVWFGGIYHVPLPMNISLSFHLV